MNKKGFTLIEMMAAIIILGVIALLAIPLVEQILVNIRNKAYEDQIESIRQGARQWGASNIMLLPSDSGSTYTITLGFLQSAGFAEREIYNPITKTLMDSALEITIVNNNGNYVYVVGADTGGEINPNTPTVTLVGNALVYIDLNGTYTEPGITAKTGAGVPIGSYTTVITNNSTPVGAIDTAVLTEYLITYSVVDSGITAKTTRTIIINDTIAPTFTAFPGNDTILNTVTSYNLMSGVTATDNSLTPVVVTVSTNLTLGVVGDYEITYTATDKYGNTTTDSRIITIEC